MVIVLSGHFSQVVWKDTKTAGFGRAKSDSGNFIIVGQYKPAGNVLGHFQENVLASTGRMRADDFRDFVSNTFIAFSTTETRGTENGQCTTEG